MTESGSKSLDILGIKPIADAVSVVTKASVDGASALLSRICLPAAEEFGYLLQDKVRGWRLKNTVAIVAAAERKLEDNQASSAVQAHPRIVAEILQHGAWTDEKAIQELWGGLLASSCDEDGHDDSNIIFVSLLSQLTKLQARIFEFSCKNTKLTLSPAGLIMPRQGLMVAIGQLDVITGIKDADRIDIELDRLRALGVISAGFTSYGVHADIAASALGLNMYVRCQGYRGSAIDYFKATYAQSWDDVQPISESP